MSEKEKWHEIERLKNIALDSKDPDVKRKTIDTLVVYGKDGVAPITDIIEKGDDAIKQYGLQAIKSIRTIHHF